MVESGFGELLVIFALAVTILVTAHILFRLVNHIVQSFVRSMGHRRFSV